MTSMPKAERYDRPCVDVVDITLENGTRMYSDEVLAQMKWIHTQLIECKNGSPNGMGYVVLQEIEKNYPEIKEVKQ